MSKGFILKIAGDGSVAGIYSDMLASLGKASICRASEVEFNHALGKWVVELKIGPYAGACLMQAFERREDALAAEVALLNEQHAACML